MKRNGTISDSEFDAIINSIVKEEEKQSNGKKLERENKKNT